MATIAITGTTGFLGSRASAFLKQKHTVIDVTRSLVDITNEKQVLDFFLMTKPQFVIHSAAISNIEVAQKNPELSDKTNRLAPMYIAKACKCIGAKLINMSSDQVYSGNLERFSLSEEVMLHPQNLYATQKLESEKLVSEVLPDAVSLRLTWMYDTPKSELFQHKAFPSQLLDAATLGIAYKVNKNQLRSITYIKDVIKNLEACFSLPGGVYNFGSENDISMYELCKHAVKLLQLDEKIIELYDGPNQNILINTSKLQSNGIFMPTAKDGFTNAFSYLAL